MYQTYFSRLVAGVGPVRRMYYAFKRWPSVRAHGWKTYG